MTELPAYEPLQGLYVESDPVDEELVDQGAIDGTLLLGKGLR